MGEDEATEGQVVNSEDVLGEGYYYEQTVKTALRWEVRYEANARKLHMDGITDWILEAGKGALQPLPIPPVTKDFVVKRGPLGDWIIDIVDTGPMFTREQIINQLTAEMGAPLSHKLLSSQLRAAGLPQHAPEVPDLTKTFGPKLAHGYLSFKGNWQEMPQNGAEAVNPADGLLYKFWRRGDAYYTGPALVGYWVFPEIWQMKENQRW